MSTAEHTDALTRRIEQLAAAALDEGDGAALAALLSALRSEIGAVRVDVGSLRSETGGLRTDLDGLEGRLVASVDAGKGETTSLLRRFASELDETVTASMDEAARASAATGSSLEDARGVLESRLAVLEDALDGLSERLEALARDGAVTTTASLQELAGTVRDLDARLTAQSTASVDAVVDRLGELVETRLAASEQRMTELLEGARARAEEDRAAAAGLAATARAQLSELGEGLDRSLAELRSTVSEQQQSVTSLTGRFVDLGDQLAGRVSELSLAVDSATAGLSSDLIERLELLEAAMGTFRSEWPTRTFEVVQGAKAVAEGVTREVRAQVEVQLERVRTELAGAVARIDDAGDGLDAQSARLAEAGKVLVTYLEQRDRLLEAERDRVLHDVLDSFAAGLSSRERGALAHRVGDAVARRRDARDGERYRTSAGSSDSSRADLPPELALLEADTVVRELSGRTPRTGAAGPPAGTPERRRPTAAPSASRPLASGISVVPPPSQLRPLPTPTASPTASPVRAVPSRPPVQAPLKRPTGAPAAPAGAPSAPGGRPAAGKAATGKAGKTGGRVPAKAPARIPTAKPRAADERRGRPTGLPEVPSVDVALEPVLREEPVPELHPVPPPELVGVIPVIAEVPAVSREPSTPEPSTPQPGTPAPPRAALSTPLTPPDAASALFARRPAAPPDEPAQEDEPPQAERDPHEDDGVRRLFRRRPRS